MNTGLAPRFGFWVGEFLLLGLELESRAFAGEGFAEAVAVGVPPVGVEFSGFLEHAWILCADTDGHRGCAGGPRWDWLVLGVDTNRCPTQAQWFR